MNWKISVIAMKLKGGGARSLRQIRRKDRKRRSENVDLQAQRKTISLQMEMRIWLNFSIRSSRRRE